MTEKVIKELPDKDMTVISITNANKCLFKWREENKEFEYSGKLYDLVKIRIRGDTIFYYCINDKQEEELFANLDNYIQKNIDNDLPQNKKVNNVLEKLIKDYVKYDYSLSILSVAKEILFTYRDKNLNPVYLKITTPPPKNYIFPGISNNSILSHQILQSVFCTIQKNRIFVELFQRL